MTPEHFIEKWRNADLGERQAAQSHFLDLCELLGEPKPTDLDPKGEWYCFEKGATKTTGGEGWADVFKRGCFAWEYKGKRRNLDDALDQIKRYALALDNPPLLIVSDLERIRIVTNWTNTVSYRHEIALPDLREPDARRKLKWAFAEPERLRPGLTRQAVTEQAARRFAELAMDLRAAGHDPHAVAHFVNRLVFCLFAEDAGLLPNRMFTRMLQAAAAQPGSFAAMASQLFAAMRAGGMVGFEPVAWFNGGIFDDDTSLPLTEGQIGRVLEAAELDWSEIDPSIMGTLFERGLDPGKRSQLGAHYTDRDKIMRIVDPVIRRPLEAAWAGTRREMEALLAKADAARTPAAATRHRDAAEKLYHGFLDRLQRFRVLDPACGSGNFLYLALHVLKDLELRAGIEAEALGIQRELLQRVGPEQLLGIEINPYAAELARVSVWIGEIQWMKRHGFDVARNPILRKLGNIQCRDALLNEDGSEATWPEAEAIIGNPPFLGDKLMIGTLGEGYTRDLRRRYEKRVPGGADLVCYWFAKAAEHVKRAGNCRAGLVATNSVRGGANRQVLDLIARDSVIFDAWNDEPWVVEGAAVRVSLVCFTRKDLHDGDIKLNGGLVEAIFPDLTGDKHGSGVNLTEAKMLKENAGCSFIGSTKKGAFDIPGPIAREWLLSPLNPNGRPNSDVLKPYANGMDVVRRWPDRWVIDFGPDLPEFEASLYDAPFSHVVREVKPARGLVRNAMERKLWWLHARSIHDLRSALRRVKRYIATPRVAKHRLFVWLPSQILPDCQLVAITRDDDTTFGILHSHLHELWSLRLCTWLGVGNDPRYTPSTTFETFPFPEGLTPNLPAVAYADDPRAQRIAAVARRLHELRENWLNPPDLVVRVPEVVPGYPERLLPRDEAAAKELRKRTLTNLYNQRPAWLDRLHRELDAAVAAAYGWPADLTGDAILERLLALNRERAAAGR